MNIKTKNINLEESLTFQMALKLQLGRKYRESDLKHGTSQVYSERQIKDAKLTNLQIIGIRDQKQAHSNKMKRQNMSLLEIFQEYQQLNEQREYILYLNAGVSPKKITKKNEKEDPNSNEFQKWLQKFLNKPNHPNLTNDRGSQNSIFYSPSNILKHHDSDSSRKQMYKEQICKQLKRLNSKHNISTISTQSNDTPHSYKDHSHIKRDRSKYSFQEYFSQPFSLVPDPSKQYQKINRLSLLALCQLERQSSML